MSNKLFQNIKAGNISYKRSPELIRLVTLRNFITHNKDYYRIAQAIKYSITTPLNNRNTSAWFIYKNCTRTKESKLKNIAVIRNFKLDSFKDIQAVDFTNYVSLCQEFKSFGKVLYKVLSS